MKTKLYFDCEHCHHSGCDRCGGTGESNNEVTDFSDPTVKQMAIDNGYQFPTSIENAKEFNDALKRLLL